MAVVHYQALDEMIRLLRESRRSHFAYHRTADPMDFPDNFSQRGIAVLRLLAAGKNNWDIAVILLGICCTALLALSLRQRGIDELLPDGIGFPDLSHGGTGFFQRHALP